MINCKYVSYNEMISFGTIIGEKYNPAKTTLLGISTRILSCYTQYLTRFASLESKNSSELSAAEVDEKTAMQLCYSSPTDSFKFIKGKIFSDQPDQLKEFCPYCLLNKPKTLDHYIGKTEFPEYSILIRNLIPSCYDCNQKKGEKWRKRKKRRYIHFHNDTFLSNRFLFAKLVFHRGKMVPEIDFFLNKPGAMSVADYQIVKFHFKDLNLLEEYNSRANTTISSEFRIMQEAKARGVTNVAIKANLLSRATVLARDYGSNYWASVLYETLEGNRKLLNSL